ncbi:MAG: Gfo/Idh/MocA family oxidoreductase [Chloroflexi bacterium]|nr:Gfo/Idh/MocA family oxidoreductase [Chloroflexota bacterium]
MRELGIGIVGVGYWGMNYVRVFSELAGSRVAVVCDRREERLLEASQRFPEVAVCSSVDELLNLSQVDAVVVCTEASSHYAMVSRALESGRHVLVEKPMTTTVPDGERLLELAAKRNLKLMVGHTFLYNAGIRKVKSLLSGGEAGRVYYMYSRRTNLGPIRRDVNALWDLAPHDVSIFNYLMDGAPEWVSAVGAKPLGDGHEAFGFLALGYPNGVVGQAHVSWADPHKVREVVVVGSDKRIVFNDLDSEGPVRVFEKGVKPVEPSVTGYGEHQLLMRDGDIIIPKLDVSEPLKNQCQHFLDSVYDGCQPLTDGRNGLDVVRVMTAVDRSIAGRGAPIAVA